MNINNIDEAIRKFNQFQKNSISANINEYHNNLEVLIFIQNYLAKSKVKFPEWKTYVDILVTKHTLHCNTIYNILKGLNLNSRLDEFEFKISDLPSAQILIRAQLENFLITDFIYFQNVEENEKYFRFNCWMYDCFLQRSKLNLVGGPGKKIQESDKIEIARLKELIIKSTYYNGLKPKQQKAILDKGDSKLFNKWDDLIKLSELKEIIINNAYIGLSIQAHSGALSVLNIKSQNFSFSQNNEHIPPILFLSDLILCVMISRFKLFSKTTEIAYNKILSGRRKAIELNSELLTKNKLVSLK